MDFVTAKDTFLRQCHVQDQLRVPSGISLEALEESLQLTRPVELRLVRDDGDARLHVSSASPIANYLGVIARDAPEFFDVASTDVAKLILEKRIRDLVSLPEQIAAATHSVGDEKSATHFNGPLYMQRVSVCIWVFSLTAPLEAPLQSDEDNGAVGFSVRQRRCVVYALLRLCIKRGAFTPMLSALKSLDNRFWAENAEAAENLMTVVHAVKEACYKPRFASARPALNEMGTCWHQFFAVLLDVAQKVSDARSHIVAALCDGLIGAGAHTDLIVDDSLTLCVRSELFSKMLTSEPTSRGTVRFIFRDIVSAISSHLDDVANDIPCLKYLFTEVFSKWGDKSFAVKGPLTVNTTRMNAVMYSLGHLHRQNTSLPSPYLGSLLNGVTARLESARSDNLRQEGMTVAAAFTAYFVSDEETSNSLFSEEQFVELLKKWSREEASDTAEELPQSTAPDSVVSTLARENVHRAAADEDVFPWHPDEAFHYFSVRGDGSSQVVTRNRAHVARVQLLERDAPLPTFGTQTIEKDAVGERIQLLETLRESYNTLLGIGRHPNAQMHEVQESIEGGLRGMSTCFEQIRSLKSVPAGIESEIDGMIATLLPTLLTLQIHAPEAKQKSLLHIRHQIIVDLISFSPKMSLFLLAQVIYSANYSVFQRTDVVKAMGEASRQLAHVRVDENGSAEAGQARAHQKRLYPPIPNTGVTSSAPSQSIVVSEGAKTRRWGYVVAGRAAAQPLYENRLAEYATAFMAALLAKSDADHFKFFQDHDPYTPSEILKTIMIVVQGTRTARHVVGPLSHQALEFLLAVTVAHPHDAVRRLAWLVANEVMRAWCGAEPLVDAENDGVSVAHRTAASRVHTSLLFSDEWIQSLEALQAICVRVSKNGDMCASVAVMVVSGIRDLVCEKTDLDDMQAQYKGMVVEA